ncbi:MAG: hypothetical protein AAGA56_27280 [Myxococcota bacterium]
MARVTVAAPVTVASGGPVQTAPSLARMLKIPSGWSFAGESN